MKLERLTEYVTVVVAVTIGLLLSLYLGISTGQGGSTPLLIIGGIVAVTFALITHTRIWILIPLCWAQTGQLFGLPIRDLAIVYSFCIFLTLKALKVIRGKLSYGWIDVLLLVNVVYIALLYIRNPVGVLLFNSEMVAGRPYAETAFAVMAYWVLGLITISPNLAKKLPLISVLGSLSFGVLNFITFHFPSTAPIISRFYSGISPENYNGSENTDPEAQREQYLEPIGVGLTQMLCSYFPPISLINPVKLGRFLIFVISVFFILRSGHRIGIMALFVIFAIGSYFRNGFADIIKMVFFGLPCLVCLICLQGVLYDLPLPAQRALSFLPGNWDYRATEDARGSSEWRYEMWRNVWYSNKYIQNRWLGDGFGITKRTLKDSQIATDIRQEADAGRENLTIVGDYHSGPLSAIKFSGYFGTALFLVLMVGNATYAWQLLKKTKGSPFFPATLFIGCDAIYYPFNFILIFGNYKAGIPDMCYSIAMLSLIKRSYNAWLQANNQPASKTDFPNHFPEHWNTPLLTRNDTFPDGISAKSSK